MVALSQFLLWILFVLIIYIVVKVSGNAGMALAIVERAQKVFGGRFTGGVFASVVAIVPLGCQRRAPHRGISRPADT